jgi:peptide/nickel transport system permease protein
MAQTGELQGPASLAGEAEATPERRRRQILKSIGRSRAGTVGWAILAFYILVAAIGPFLTLHDPNEQDLRQRMAPPSFGLDAETFRPMGSDQLGRDILTRVIYGARISIFIGIAVVALGGIIGVGVGIVAGFRRGWVDRVAMRLVDIYLAFPFVLLALIVIGVLGPSLTNLIVVLAITGWVNYARVIRSEVLSLREREFIVASQVMGAPSQRIFTRHLLPNVAPTVIVLASLELARVVILEGSLSFLGLGVQPPTPSWGRMLAEGRDYIATAWWLATFPGLAILFLVLSVNLVGDWMRDEFDPRRRGV